MLPSSTGSSYYRYVGVEQSIILTYRIIAFEKCIAFRSRFVAFSYTFKGTMFVWFAARKISYCRCVVKQRELTHQNRQRRRQIVGRGMSPDTHCEVIAAHSASKGRGWRASTVDIAPGSNKSH
jgi:hypothetical protein